eukprot:g30236.t1
MTALRLHHRFTDLVHASCVKLCPTWTRLRGAKVPGAPKVPALGPLGDNAEPGSSEAKDAPGPLLAFPPAGAPMDQWTVAKLSHFAIVLGHASRRAKAEPPPKATSIFAEGLKLFQMDTPAASTEKEAAPKPATSPEAPKASPAGDEDDEIVGERFGSGVREFERAMGCGASAEKKAEAELTSTTDGKEVPMEQKVQLAAAPQAESSAPANPCTAAPEMLEAMQKLVDATAQEQKGLKVQEVLKVQNAQMQHRYDHFAADLHRNFGSSIARHVVLTDDLGPAELRKEINEMYLFHGTSPTDTKLFGESISRRCAKQIASSDFDFKEEAGHVRTTFGLGLHLPEAAGRAHENSKVEDSLRALLLVKAVGGNIAVTAGHSDCLKMLLEADAEMDIEDLFSSTPLHEAAENGCCIA